MAVIDNILTRRGYVKLSDYGLALTPDGRIVAQHAPVTVGDDRFGGGYIVGWRPFDPPMAAAPQAPAPMAPRPAAPPIPVAARAAAAPAPAAAKPAGPTAAQADEESDDDEWEWQLALARARAAAEEAERAAPAPRMTVARAGVAPPSARHPAPFRATPPVPPPQQQPRSVVPPFVRAPIGAAVGVPVRSSMNPPPRPSAPPPRPATAKPAAPVAKPAAPAPVAKPTAPAPVAKQTAPAAPLPPPPQAARPAAIVAPPVAAATPAARTIALSVTPLPPASPRRFPRGTGPVKKTAAGRLVALIPPIATAGEIGEDTSEITNDVTDLGIGDVTSVDRANAPAEPPVYARPAHAAAPIGLPRLTARR